MESKSNRLRMSPSVCIHPRLQCKQIGTWVAQCFFEQVNSRTSRIPSFDYTTMPYKTLKSHERAPRMQTSSPSRRRHLRDFWSLPCTAEIDVMWDHEIVPFHNDYAAKRQLRSWKTSATREDYYVYRRCNILYAWWTALCKLKVRKKPSRMQECL